MKGNSGRGNSPIRDSWLTPSWIFDPLHKQYTFEYDCCAQVDNTKCKYYSNNFETIDIVTGMAWMNPPFSLAYKMFEHFFRVVIKGIAIYRCDNLETALWQDIILPKASWIFIPNKRVNYEGLDGEGVRFPSALIGKITELPKLKDGRILKLEQL